MSVHTNQSRFECWSIRFLCINRLLSYLFFRRIQVWVQVPIIFIIIRCNKHICSIFEEKTFDTKNPRKYCNFIFEGSINSQEQNWSNFVALELCKICKRQHFANKIFLRSASISKKMCLLYNSVRKVANFMELQDKILTFFLLSSDSQRFRWVFTLKKNFEIQFLSIFKELLSCLFTKDNCFSSGVFFCKRNAITELTLLCSYH